MSYNKIFFLCIIPILFSCTNEDSKTPMAKPIVQKGTDTGGGGDMLDIQKHLVDFKKTSLISELQRVTQKESAFLKKSLIGFATYHKSYELPESIQSIMQDMLDRGLVDDINNTKIIEGTCFDKNGIQRTATSAMNQKGADICFDSRRVVEALGAHIPDSSLLSLLIHEYAHHFGYEDADYAIAQAVLIAIQKESEAMLERGENPNNLIKNNLWIYESKEGEIK